MKSIKTNAQKLLLEEGAPEQQQLLPFLWQVIYQEALRANHILFSKKDVDIFEQSGRKTLFKASVQDQDVVSKAMIKMLATPDLTAMHKLIETLSFHQRQSLFFVYRRFIESWRLFHKESLH